MPCPDEGVLLRLQRSSGVRGRVVDARGRPVSRETVYLQREGFPVDRRVLTVRDDAAEGDSTSGTFRFRHVMPGTYRLWVGDGDLRDERVIVVGEASSAPAEAHELVLRKKP